MNAKDHWQTIYQAKAPEQLSWFQAEATLSRDLIIRFAPDRDAKILDVGAGASTLVDGLVLAGYHHVTVLDISAAALEHARRRLGAAAETVRWREADVLTASFTEGAIEVWHDRAVFHFLTEASDRERYVAQVRRAVKPGGLVLVATFAEDGPTRCSGLETRRYSPDALHAEFGVDFQIISSQREEHITPTGTKQAFTYCVCRYFPAGQARAAA
jgi:SAM-dependent methyltransferase